VKINKGPLKRLVLQFVKNEGYGHPAVLVFIQRKPWRGGGSNLIILFQ